MSSEMNWHEALLGSIDVEMQGYSSSLEAPSTPSDMSIDEGSSIGSVSLEYTPHQQQFSNHHHHIYSHSPMTRAPQADIDRAVPHLFLQNVTSQKYEAPSTAGNTPAPCARFGHTAVIYNNKMVVYGGRNAECLGDVWTFDFLERNWAPIHIPVGPCPRAGHTAVVFGSKMFIFGGVGNKETGNWLNDMWALDLERFTWAEVTPKEGKVPQGRKGHTSVVSRGSMFVFGGGQDDETLYNDVWEFKFEDCSWSQQVLTGTTKLHPRMYHVAVLIPGDKMIIFGGRAHTETGFLNDVVEIALHAPGGVCRYTELTPGGTPPTHRMCSTAIYHNHTVAIFTGGSFSYLEDSHQLDLQKMQWTPIDNVTFGGRTRPTTVKWRNTIMTFGGCVHVDGYVNDFVEVELEPMSLMQTMREYLLENRITDREGLPPHMVRFLDE